MLLHMTAFHPSSSRYPFPRYDTRLPVRNKRSLKLLPVADLFPYFGNAYRSDEAERARRRSERARRSGTLCEYARWCNALVYRSWGSIQTSELSNCASDTVLHDSVAGYLLWKSG